MVQETKSICPLGTRLSWTISLIPGCLLPRPKQFQNRIPTGSDCSSSRITFTT